MPQFIYQFSPRYPEKVANPSLFTPDDLALMDAHVAYLQQATSEKIVILAGRAQDNVGPAIVIIEMPDEAAAQTFMHNDPFVAGGFADATLHPYRVAFSRNPI